MKYVKSIYFTSSSVETMFDTLIQCDLWNLCQLLSGVLGTGAFVRPGACLIEDTHHAFPNWEVVYETDPRYRPVIVLSVIDYEQILVLPKFVRSKISVTKWG